MVSSPPVALSPSSPHLPRRHGFSLVELLIVIAVIGIIVSSVMISFGGMYREAILKVRDRRNAQEVVSLTNGAEAAGAAVIQPHDLAATVQNLIEGREGTRGAFKGRLFRLSKMTEEEVAGALNYVQWDQGQIIYIHGAD